MKIYTLTNGVFGELYPDHVSEMDKGVAENPHMCLKLIEEGIFAQATDLPNGEDSRSVEEVVQISIEEFKELWESCTAAFEEKNVEFLYNQGVLLEHMIFDILPEWMWGITMASGDTTLKQYYDERYNGVDPVVISVQPNGTSQLNVMSEGDINMMKMIGPAVMGIAFGVLDLR